MKFKKKGTKENNMRFGNRMCHLCMRYVLVTKIVGHL